ncbi:UDP-N-acetylmuramoyl-tripeptide--D-alanyl-D-alanine ligase [Helcococcus massiliensis]|uniref:UDP-N-acetylmuramoyl-tripeptide--D-alanyl-D- alanine ligase n=1 Tax=Helcococcus massiliensis TaxID=2040290 RepID=UPI000CDE6366|nr:UDP-N-acetylmuramoyl-tripeptide--D-alanyl-D-alanine ligase [Helcococcus massiliensis]
MLNLTLKEITQLAGGELNNEKFEDLVINDVSIDTRTLNQDDLYIPIIGENFDGHKFIDSAIMKGAKAIFSEQGKFVKDDFPIIYVNDTTEALQDFSSKYRQSLDIKIIAITGSNGKTSTKDLISKILEEKYVVSKTIGNLNNHIGLPLTLLKFNKDTNIGVVEMGTDGFGQIEVLSKIARPDIAIITNIGDSHLEELKTKENIAKEKLHIIDYLAEDGVFYYNLDDPILTSEYKKLNKNIRDISFGKDPKADYRLNIIESNNKGSLFTLNDDFYNLTLIGKHQVYNASVAIAVAEEMGIEEDKIKHALLENEASSMRTELMNMNGFDILNDSYKSNPQSLLTALDTLSILDGYRNKIAILGDMLELGENEEELHRNIGRQIDPNNLDYLLLFGPLSKYIYEEAVKVMSKNRVFYFDNKDKLVDKAKYIIKRGDIVLVKASRSMHLEEIIESLGNLTL